jgi:hypothetical protein
MPRGNRINRLKGVRGRGKVARVRGIRGTARWRFVAAGLGALAFTGCGGGSRQDADEAAGTYPVNIVRASFPTTQRIAGQVAMVITVNNPGTKTIPDIAATIEGPRGAAAAAAFGASDSQVGLADPSRPIWIVDRGPRGGDTAYVNTWSLGKLAPHQEKTFTWFVTPTVAGTHTVRYRIAAGLDGKAKAQLVGGGVPVGTFTVAVSAKPAGVKVSPNGDVTSSPPTSKAVPPGYPVEP